MYILVFLQIILTCLCFYQLLLGASSSIECAVILRRADSVEWTRHFGSSFSTVESGMQLFVSTTGTSAGCIFDHATLVSAFDTVRRRNSVSATQDSPYARVLRACIENPELGTLSSIQMSHFVSSFGPCVVNEYFSQYRSILSSLNVCHIRNVQSAPNQLSDSDWQRMGQAGFDGLYTGRLNTGRRSGGSKSGDLLLHGASSFFRDCKRTNHITNNFVCLNTGEVVAHEGALEPVFDNDNELLQDNYDGSGSSAAAMPTSGHGDDATAEGRAGIAPTTTIAVVNINSPVSANYEDFARYITSSAKCIHMLEGEDGDLNALFALSAYNHDSQKRSHGPPVLVEYIRVGGAAHVLCTCPAARLAVCAISTTIPGIEGKQCWHETCLRDTEIFRRIASPIALCDPNTGIPKSEIVCILGAKQAALNRGVKNVPSRLYVGVHTSQGLGSPGNMRFGILTLCLVKQKLQATCSSCGSANKCQLGVTKKAACRHYALVLSKATKPVSSDEKLLSAFFSHANTARTDEDSPVFDTQTQRWDFPSYDARAAKQSEVRTGVPGTSPTFPWGMSSWGSSESFRSRHPVSLGGPGDPKTVRFKVLLETCQHGADSALLLNDLVHQHCSSDSTRLTLSDASGFQQPLDTFMSLCSRCSVILTTAYSSCDSCCSHICGSCRLSAPAMVNPLFGYCFPEFNYKSHPVDASLSYFVDLVDRVRVAPTNTPLVLKPPLPPQNSELSGICECSYSEDGYVLNRLSTVYGLSYSEPAQVFDLNCSARHSTCFIPFIGSSSALHCQTSQLIYRVELFEYFWFLLRHVKGTGVSSYVELVELLYIRNRGSNFVSAPSFRDAVFGFFSSLHIDFNTKCLTCRVYKDPTSNVLFSGCPVLQYDAVHLRAKANNKATACFDAPVEGSPIVDCLNEHIYDRLFIPGSRKNDIGALRSKTKALCKRVQDDPPSCAATKASFLLLPDAFRAYDRVSYFASSIELLVFALGHPVTTLVRNLANMYLRIVDDHAGEILQIINMPEILFLEDVLNRCKPQGPGLGALYLKLAVLRGVRESLVDLVRSAVQPRDGGAAAMQSNPGPVLNEAVLEMLQGMLKAAKREFERAGMDRADHVLPLERRPVNDPSKSGIVMNFTQGGQALRLPPKFIRTPCERGSKESKCRKPQHLTNRHQKFMNKTKGLFNVVCLVSSIPMGFMLMQTHEGRSMGVMLPYLYLPRFPRMVSSDIGCQGASWAHARLRFYFRLWRWILDHFHLWPHKCKLITDPREFSVTRGLNDSFTEQLHALQRMLGMTMASTSEARATFLIQLINYDIYCARANEAKISMEDRSWPDARTVPFYTDSSYDLNPTAQASGDLHSMAGAERDVIPAVSERRSADDSSVEAREEKVDDISDGEEAFESSAGGSERSGDAEDSDIDVSDEDNLDDFVQSETS